MKKKKETFGELFFDTDLENSQWEQVYENFSKSKEELEKEKEKEIKKD